MVVLVGSYFLELQYHTVLVVYYFIFVSVKKRAKDCMCIGDVEFKS